LLYGNFVRRLTRHSDRSKQRERQPPDWRLGGYRDVTALQPGNILDLQYNFNSGHDNGNVMGITNNRDSTRTQAFTYDQVNRIVTAAASTYSQSSAHCWGETYTYDQWANMSAIGSISSSYTGCVQDSLSVSVNSNNQLSSTGFTYDAAGNLMFTPAPGAAGYTYNAESEITQASVSSVTNYIYDGDGNRLEKSAAPNGVYKIYWYGGGTEILDESDGSGNFTNEYVFFGGRRIAIRNVSSGTIDYYEEDMLGSSRTIVQAGQTSVCFDADFLPFGYEKDVTTTCSQNYKFEGKERDTETSNDDFGARYYTFRLGRWLSADWSSVPAPVPYANLSNPQTLNLYAMVSDNPESFADLDGHDSIPSTTGGCVITPGGAQGCKSTANVNVPETTGDGPGAQKTGTGTPPSTTQQAQGNAAKPTFDSKKFAERVVMAGEAAVNLEIGNLKLGAAQKLATAAPETGPGAVLAGIGAALLGVSASGNFAAGNIQLVGALTGHTEEAAAAAKTATTVTSASGFVSLLATGGNLAKAGKWAAREAIFTTSPKDLLQGKALEVTAKMIDFGLSLKDAFSH
jgi:RHS repeat-associated protein